MENIEIIEIENAFGEKSTHVIIHKGNGEFTSMSKAHYDELEAAKEKQSGTL